MVLENIVKYIYIMCDAWYNNNYRKPYKMDEKLFQIHKGDEEENKMANTNRMVKTLFLHGFHVVDPGERDVASTGDELFNEQFIADQLSAGTPADTIREFLSRVPGVDLMAVERLLTSK